MSDYPKMLYKGDQKNFEDSTVHDDIEEQVLRDSGWVDYINLPEREMGVAGGSIGDTEERFESFRNDVAAMKERIAELQGDATPIGATNENEGRIVELKKLTVPQLKELAASKGIQFKSNASEKTLIELILTHDAAQADSME